MHLACTYLQLFVCVLLLTVSSKTQAQLRILPKLAYPTELDGTAEFATFDVDSDGDIDVLSVNAYVDNLFINDGFGRLSRASASQFPPKNKWPSRQVDVGDVDGDGDEDIVFGHDRTASPYSVKIYLNNGSGGFQDAGVGCLPPAHESTVEIMDLKLSDVDRDGDLDMLLFLGLHHAGTIRLWKNDGQGNFADVTATHLPPLWGKLRIGVAADVTGDIYPDIVCSPMGGGPYLFVNDGSGRFSEETRTRIPNNTLPGAEGICVGDVDGDGDADIVSGSRFGQGTRVWINDGRGFFVEETKVRMPDDANLYETARSYLVDLDRDGDLDLYLQNWWTSPPGSNNRVYMNNGHGRFVDDSSRWFPLWIDEQMLSCAFADLDGDGDPELLTARANGTLQNRLYMNTSRQIYTPYDAVRGKPYPLEIYGEAKEIVFLAMGLKALRQDAQPLGVLQLDLSQSILLPDVTLLPSTGQDTVPLVIPAMPSLLGQDIYTQALFWNPQRPERTGLSNAVHDVIQ